MPLQYMTDRRERVIVLLVDEMDLLITKKQQVGASSWHLGSLATAMPLQYMTDRTEPVIVLLVDETDLLITKKQQITCLQNETVNFKMMVSIA